MTTSYDIDPLDGVPRSLIEAARAELARMTVDEIRALVARECARPLPDEENGR